METSDTLTPKPKGLISKLCEVMTEVSYIQKRGHNERFNYDYATEADVVNSLRDKLASRNVFVFPSVVSEDRKELGKTNSGAVMLITDIMVKWTFVDGDTGESQECLMPGCGSDTGDKGIYKAITGSSKYMFLKAFMLPTGDDPENEKIDREEAKQNAQMIGRRVAAEKQAAIDARKVGKPENAIGNPETHANGGMDQNHKDRHESLTLAAFRGGMVALSGPGLSIVRAEMTKDDRAFFGIKLMDGTVFCLPDQKLVFKFQDLCTRLGVKAEWADNQPPHVPRAVIPPADTIQDQSAAQSIDPILFEAKVVEQTGKKPFMDLNWSGKHHSTFNKSMWPILIAAIGKPVMLETKANGKYSNVVRLLRVDGVNFADEQNQTTIIPDGVTADDSWVPF